VNVFLGLGLPWTVASIYHSSSGGTYEVPAGELGLSVAIFTSLAVLTIALLMIKRKQIGAELGGEGFWRKGLGLTFVAFWFIYALLASLNAYGHL
jgi:solute carrier family 8 (sodium/calcium exchanger)